jgi:putative transposase
VYLVAIIDWYSRKVLAWKLSTTMDTRFCTECLSEAILLHGKPEIFNTDQGSQFTSEEFTEILKGYEIRISMDGKGRWVDNVFTERLWRSLKQNEVYRNDYESPLEAYKGISDYFKKYNSYDPHQSLGYQTPDETYYGCENTKKFPITIPEKRIWEQETSHILSCPLTPALVLS